MSQKTVLRLMRKERSMAEAKTIKKTLALVFAALVAAAFLVVPAGTAQADVRAASVSAEANDVIPMYRLYNRWSGEHLYTASESEYNKLATIGWLQEGIAWRAPSSGDPVYRLYNKYSGDHHYTTSKSEYDSLGRIGWNQEGVGFYSNKNKSLPVYRGFNRYATIGTHHYTTDGSEMNSMVKNGWTAEGTGWYGMAWKAAWSETVHHDAVYEFPDTYEVDVCSKCGYECESDAVMYEHIRSVHAGAGSFHNEMRGGGSILITPAWDETVWHQAGWY